MKSALDSLIESLERSTWRPKWVAGSQACLTDRLPASDPYAERVREALRQINAPDYPAGMVPWLDTVRPDLYAALTSHLPNAIQRLWTEREGFERFEAALARLVTLHHQCCDLYRARRANEAACRSDTTTISACPKINRSENLVADTVECEK